MVSADVQKTLSQALDAHKKEKHGEAMLLYQRVLDLDPTSAQAHNNLASIYFLLQKYQDALRHFKAAYDLKPEDPDFRRGLATGLCMIGDKATAEKLFSAVLEDRPDDLIAVEYMAKIYLESARMEQLLRLLHPYYPDDWQQIEFLFYYCMALIGLQQYDKALQLVRDVQAKHGGDVRYLRLLGAVLLQMSRYDEAVPIMRRTTELEPQEIGNWSNLCAACKGAYLFDEGIKAGEKALSINPESFDALSNLGVIHREKGDGEKSLAYLRRALELRPTYHNIHYNIGLSMVAAGYLREGWPETEWRWQTDMNRHVLRPEKKPQWRGQDIGNAHLVLYTDQGVGDTIQMARFLPLVRARCPEAKISLRCEAKLIPLLKAHYGDFTFISHTDMELGDVHSCRFDYHHPLVSLLATLAIDIDAIPDKAYLKAPQPINYKDRPNQKIIGLSWYTRSVNTGFKRSLALEEFSFLKDFADVKIIDLQYGDTGAEREENAKKGFHVFHDDGVDAWADLQPFVNQVAGCDLVISIDNTTVHVAGALGVPVWTIIPFIPYWRWTLNHEQSPWYETMRFFQQSAPGKYDDVIARVKAGVTAWEQGNSSVLTPSKKYAPLVPPYKERQSKKLVAVLNAPSPLIAIEKQISGQGLIARIKERNYDVIEITGSEIERTPILPPSLVEFDTELYAGRWAMLNPSLVDQIQRADKIVVNGENAIAGTRPLALKLLYLAYYAKKFAGRPVSILNHSVFPEENAELTDPNIVAYYRKVYLACDDVAVIDPLSQSLLQQLQIPCRLTSEATLPPSQEKSSQQNTLSVFLAGFTALKQAELLAQIAGLMANDGMTLSLPYYVRDAEGFHTAQQVAALVKTRKTIAVPVHNIADFHKCVYASAALLTNEIPVISLAQTLSKKLLAIPGALPDTEAYCHAHGIALANVEIFRNIKGLSPLNTLVATGFEAVLPQGF